MEEFIDHQLGTLTLATAAEDLRDLAFSANGQDASPAVLKHLVTEKFRNIATWLLTLINPANLTRTDLRRLRKEARKYCIIQDMLWERSPGDKPLRRVIDDPDQQEKILQALHEDSGHRGREGTWRKVWSRYSWPGMFNDVDKHVRTCKECQLHSTRTVEEELHPIWGPEMT